MYAIAPPLKPDDSGDQVANLQAALLFLLDRDALKSFDPPRNPRADELKALTEGLRTEQTGQSFSPATQKPLAHLQLQEGRVQGVRPIHRRAALQTAAQRWPRS